MKDYIQKIILKVTTEAFRGYTSLADARKEAFKLYEFQLFCKNR